MSLMDSQGLACILINSIHYQVMFPHRLYNNYLQQLCREIIEFLLYRGFPRPIGPAIYHERSEGYFAGQIGQGNPR